MKFNIFGLRIFSFNSYVFYLTRGFIASTRAFSFLTRDFNLPTRAFNLATRDFSLLTHGFELVTRGFELVTCNSYLDLYFSTMNERAISVWSSTRLGSINWFEILVTISLKPFKSLPKYVLFYMFKYVQLLFYHNSFFYNTATYPVLCVLKICERLLLKLTNLKYIFL